MSTLTSPEVIPEEQGRGSDGPSKRSRRDRPGPSGYREKKSRGLTAIMVIFLVYSLVPLFYLVVNSTKSQDSLLASFGLWFGDGFHLFDNIQQVFTYNGGPERWGDDWFYERWRSELRRHTLAILKASGRRSASDSTAPKLGNRK